MTRFDPLEILRRLDERGVRFVLIGGVAAAAHGSPSVTQDLDVCCETSVDNLERLAEVLRGIHATLRGAPPDLPFNLDAETLARGDHFTFSTDMGDFDCIGTPAGTRGYQDLAAGAQRVDLDGISVLIASLDDLIRMKRATGRAKDRAEVEILGAVRDEVEREDD